MAELNGDVRCTGDPLPWEDVQDKIRFRPSELTLWSGYNHSGKSQILTQVIAWLLLTKRCLIASLEMTPEKTMLRMLKQVSGVSEPTESFTHEFLNWTDDRLWLLDHVGTISPKYMIALANYAAAELGIEHIVIDSLMMMNIHQDDHDGQGFFVNSLIQLCHLHGVHIHLVAHQRKPSNGEELGRGSRYGIKGSSLISDKPDNVIIVSRNERKEEANDLGDHHLDDQADGLLIVDKQRHGNHWTGKLRIYFSRQSEQFVRDASRQPLQYRREV